MVVIQRSMRPLTLFLNYSCNLSMLLPWPAPLLVCSVTTEILRYVHCYLLQIPHGRHTRLSKLQLLLLYVCVCVCLTRRERERERKLPLMATFVLEGLLLCSVTCSFLSVVICLCTGSLMQNRRKMRSYI